MKKRNWRLVVVFILVRCVILLLATEKTCQRKLVNSFTPANKTCQGKTCQRKFVFHTHEHMTLSMTLVKENLLVCNRLKA